MSFQTGTPLYVRSQGQCSWKIPFHSFTHLPHQKSHQRLKLKMGAFVKLIDAILFVFFVAIALAVPLIDAQACLPVNFYPPFLVDLKTWYTDEYGDYLFTEKPHFFVGIMWLQLLFQWPLALVNIFAILTSKSWLNTTCLIYGSSVLTSMVNKQYLLVFLRFS